VKTLKNQIDVLRLDYLCELSDMLAARAVALRMAATSGDISTYDAMFAAVRLIATDMKKTRDEIQVIDDGDTNREEAA